MFSITTDLLDGPPLTKKMDAFSKAGFKYIHWCEFWSRSMVADDAFLSKVQHELERTGLLLLDTHNAESFQTAPSSADETKRQRGVSRLKQHINFTSALKGDCVVIHPGPFVNRRDRKYKERWDSLHRSIDDVAPLCYECGVRLAVENMPYRTPPEFYALFDRYPHTLLGFCFDSGHANIANESSLLRTLGSRLIALHLHDNDGKRDQHMIPGTGTVDWAEIAEGIRAADYQKPLNFELCMRTREDRDRGIAVIASEAFRSALKYF